MSNAINAEKDFPFVSIIIPCRNEEKFISSCLDSIIENDYPKERLEALIVDGMSNDGTREIVNKYSKEYPYIKLLENPKKIFSSAMNMGIRNAEGEFIMIMSGHSTFDKGYIRKCVEYLDKYEADNVGGVLRIIPRSNTLVSKSIALSLSHFFGSGNAYAKIGTKEPRWVDTAAFGCYRKDIFKKIGLFNENLLRSADMDFNVRLRKLGGKILLAPELFINYYADPNFKSFWKHNFADGVWATYVIKFKSEAWSWRHWIPLCFICSLITSTALSILVPKLSFIMIGIMGAYGAVNIGSSIQISIREKVFRNLFYLPIAFGTRHFAHGFGALFGLFLVLTPGILWKGRRSGKEV